MKADRKNRFFTVLKLLRCLLFAVLAAGLVATTEAASPHGRPNVILIVTDDQGYADMSCHGNPWLKTPNLDRLHAESVCLKDYHVDPLCTPTRAALMTGRYSLRVGAWAVTEGRQLLNRDEKTMADVFLASGYRTAMFGKWHLGDAIPYAPQYRGFLDVVCHKAGGVGEIGNPAGDGYFDATYFRNGKPEKFSGYCTEAWFNETLRVIRQGDPKPFFVYLPLNAMHGPHTVAEKYSARFTALGMSAERSKFFGQIENFDENLGRLLATLRESGREQNTIVIFMGDNGTATGSNGKGKDDDGFNAGMRGKKSSVYEGGHRVACLARWPSRWKGGRSVEQLTAHIDWLPTLIELCGLTAPVGVKFDGRSLAPLLDGKAEDWPERILFEERQADVLKRWHPGQKPNVLPQFAAMNGRWRLVNGELYELSVDPGQTTDLASKHPDITKRLLAAHEEWFTDVTSHRGNYTRFVIGAAEENPTVFTVRDWHPEVGRVIWEAEQLTDDNLVINGFWAIEAIRAGRYAIQMSRFPLVAEKPMGVSEARIRLGDMTQSRPLKPTDDSVTFEMMLSTGPTLLRTWLKDAATGRERGAYFIRAEWLGANAGSAGQHPQTLTQPPR